MGLFSSDIRSMDDLLLHGLHDIYYAEQEITEALPKMIDQATNRSSARSEEPSRGNQQADRAPRPGLQEARQDAAIHRLSGDRWSDQGGRQHGGRNRGQV